jgi:hypothetical protein
MSQLSTIGRWNWSLPHWLWSIGLLHTLCRTRWLPELYQLRRFLLYKAGRSNW